MRPNNRLDEAIAELLAEQDMPILADAAFDKVDEIAFDHTRRRASVVRTRQRGEHILICKGDPDQVFDLCSRGVAGRRNRRVRRGPARRGRGPGRGLPQAGHAGAGHRDEKHPAALERYTRIR